MEKFHGKCMHTVIVPICKNKNGDISDAGNYRPVSLATIISKLFEHTFCPASHHFWVQQTISLASSQKLGTNMCIFLLKQTVFYVSKDTPVFSAFLDTSKAFDR